MPSTRFRSRIFLILFCLVVGGMGYIIVRHVHQIRTYRFALHPPMLVLAVFFFALNFLFTHTVFYLYCRFQQVSIPYIGALKASVLGGLGKYVPIKVGTVIGKYMLLKVHNIRSRQAWRAVGFETITFIFSGTLLAWSFMRSLQKQALLAPEVSNLSGPLLGAVLVLACLFLLGLVAFPPKAAPRFYLSALAVVLPLAFLSWLSGAAGFYCLAKAIDVSQLQHNFFVLSFAFVVSYVVGFIVIFMPGGIGIREGALIVTLKPFYPLWYISILALACRILLTLMELVTAFAFIRVKGSQTTGSVTDG